MKLETCRLEFRAEMVQEVLYYWMSTVCATSQVLTYLIRWPELALLSADSKGEPGFVFSIQKLVTSCCCNFPRSLHAHSGSERSEAW